MATRGQALEKSDILLGLERLNAQLAARETRGEICIYGGACLCLAFAARNSTKDIDATFEPAAIIRKAAFEVAGELGWDWNWLNDDVRGFLSTVSNDGVEQIASCEYSHLKVYGAKADYLLAMKCLAARQGGDSHDLGDAVWLAKSLGICERKGLVEIVLRYFPDREPPERTDFFLSEILEQLKPAE